MAAGPLTFESEEVKQAGSRGWANWGGYWLEVIVPFQIPPCNPSTHLGAIKALILCCNMFYHVQSSLK